MIETAHATFDDVTQVAVATEYRLLIVDDERRQAKDYAYLTHLVYRDDENGVLYATTRVSIIVDSLWPTVHRCGLASLVRRSHGPFMHAMLKPC